MDVSGEKTCVRCVKEYTKVCGLKYQDGNPEFDSADSYMYKNKQLCKKQNQWVKADTIITADAVYLSLPVRYCALSGVCISQSLRLWSSQSGLRLFL